MKRIIFALSFLVLASCAAHHQNLNLQGMPAGAPTQRFGMTLESYRIIPASMTVKAGTHVVIDVTSRNATHELVIEAFAIHVTVPEGQSATVEFFANAPGTYDYGCHLGLGLHYAWGMKGTLTVTP